MGTKAAGGMHGNGALFLGGLLTLLWAAAGVAVYLAPGRPAVGLLAWGLGGIAGAWLLYGLRLGRGRAAVPEAGAAARGAAIPALPAPLRHLRRAAHESGRLLDATAYLAAQRLFARAAADAGLLATLRAMSPEYGRDEFLLPVDEAGAPAFPPDGVLADFRRQLARRPAFGRWFQEAEYGGRPVLLAARWLCHLAGLRHRAVLLFLDHPTRADCTLMQVRGLSRPEAPGCFDLPVAGHVPGTATPEEALAAEMAEELGLRAEDVVDLRPVGAYASAAPDENAARCNAEYRQVYRARVAAGFMDRARFADGEVAALALFSLEELRALLAAQPERAAAGLAESAYLLDGE